MGRKGESIFLRKDGRYEGRYIKDYDENGKAIYGYVYAKTYQECKRKRSKVFLVEKKKQISFNKKSKIDLNYLLDNWLREKKSKIKESSYSRYYQLIETHIRKEIGKIKVGDLTSEKINNFLTSKLQKGRLNGQGGLSKNTVYDIALILKQVLKENNINFSIMSISKTTGKGKTLYPDERKQLQTHLIELKNPISTGILLSLLLGLREGEICGLKWSDIDLKNQVIHIQRTVTRVKSFDTNNKTKVVITTPKTENSKRELPIPEKLYTILIKLKENTDLSFYVLTGSKKYMDPRTYYNHYKKILNSISDMNHTYHDLRHTFATNCIEIGMDAKTLMELLGHSNISTTMNIYVHGSLSNKRNFINQL